MTQSEIAAIIESAPHTIDAAGTVTYLTPWGALDVFANVTFRGWGRLSDLGFNEEVWIVQACIARSVKLRTLVGNPNTAEEEPP